MNTKNILKVIIAIPLILFYSCELDNYTAPDSAIHGGIYDEITGELIQQDIINGAQIEYIEHGYDNPEIQYLRFKPDGTFRNNLMFANTYTITPVRGNFVPIDSRTVDITGSTSIDFRVQPYIRINNVKIENKEGKIVATFNIEQTVTDRVHKIGLYGHLQPSVGEPMRSVYKESVLNAAVDEATLYHLEIDIATNSANLTPGQEYYFRVGARIDIGEAKFNYAPAVRIKI